MKIACIQMNISLCSKKENLECALSLAEKAVSKGAELLVFPEVFSTGFCYEHIKDAAESVSGPTLEALRSFSKEHDCILAGSIIEKMENAGKEPGSIERDKVRGEVRKEEQGSFQYNLGFCIESGKLAGTHRKTHLYGPEKEHFARGNRIAPIRLEKHGLTIGLIVCNELRYPEVARKLALEGADILVSAAEIPDFFGYPWRTISLSRALENQLPHVACNRVGIDRYSTYLGGSFIADGWGSMLAEAGKEECVLVGEIDLEKAKETRETTSIFGDRRPELY
ncbi:nitrilase-related carbon-nitrogen hydrolase [Methanosarcina sp. Mfa9]|uniref:nitrilase-related carbon-nitrogen hydrolase n=1 Tax=Methanosarcina sp. Mfa9 TaxID=3439063 RepID=UPI003F829DFF